RARADRGRGHRAAPRRRGDGRGSGVGPHAGRCRGGALCRGGWGRGDRPGPHDCVSSAAMDDVARFCARMLGDTPAARDADATARAEGGDDRSAMLRAAVAAVRQGSEPASEPAPNAPAAMDDGPAHPADRPTDPGGLQDAIARELTAAAGQLPLAQREALALRELLGLGYDELGAAAGIAPEEVSLLLARAR